eukprot:TRINITY_DN2167_c0_g1_i2.p1 TRINITY_DN2167_c0_g1~~TRINITY_DN2167_c0_g1_i2.p1  ORF type:complete len:145 (+),score=47.56 TRINITY_DN2167_c0_g1_i2:191-625(+)
MLLQRTDVQVGIVGNCSATEPKGGNDTSVGFTNDLAKITAFLDAEGAAAAAAAAAAAVGGASKKGQEDYRRVLVAAHGLPWPLCASKALVLLLPAATADVASLLSGPAMEAETCKLVGVGVHTYASDCKQIEWLHQVVLAGELL